MMKTERERVRERENKLVSGHLGEGLVQFVGDGLELLLLVHQFMAYYDMFWMS